MTAPLRKIVATYEGGVCTRYHEMSEILECGHNHRVAIRGENVTAFHPIMNATHRRCRTCVTAETLYGIAKAADDFTREWNLKYNVYS